MSIRPVPPGAHPTTPTHPFRRHRVALLAATLAISTSMTLPFIASADPQVKPAKRSTVTAQQAQKLEMQRRQKLAANEKEAQAQALPGEEIPLDKTKLQNLEVSKVVATSYGARFEMGSFVGRVRFLSGDVVKVSIQAAGQPNFNSPAIVDTTLGKYTITRKKTSSKYVMKTKSVSVEVALDKFGVTMRDKNGKIINRDDDRFGSGYENGKPYVFKKTSKDEAFYGFGEQTKGLNKRGDSIGMWNTDHYAYEADAKYIYASIPFFTGLKNNKAYGIFFDNTHHSHFEMANEADDYYYFYAQGGELNYYFINGPKMGDVLKRYTQLTGRYHQPPTWSLGWEQSHWGYKPSSKIVEVAKGYRDREIPLEAMNLDIDYMNGWRVFTWDPQWGDPHELDDQLEAMNVKTIAINDPGVKQEKGYWMSDEGTEKGYWATNPDGSDYSGAVWAGTSNFPDFTRKDVRSWWAKQFPKLVGEGVEGIWLDMNEPAVFDGPNHTAPLDVEFGNGTKQHTEVHNLYGFYNTVATYDGLKLAKPNQRAFVFSRDMYAGSQRYAALWSGDNVSSWDHLKMTLPLNMNVGLSGVPHVGNDIGGFVKDTTAELFARWMETGAFAPFARVHYDNTFQPDQQCQEPWCLGPETEAIGKKYIQLRYALLPYTITAFHNATKDGRPVQQALVYQFQTDPTVRNIDDQFMWGNDMMVAPVVTQGQTRRDVYLPKGQDWVDWWTGETFTGGQWISREAPLDTMPIYVKKGRVIPTREVQQYTGENPFTHATLHAFLKGSTAKGTIYEDDGISEKYLKGEWNQWDFTVSQSKGGSITVKTTKSHKGYDSKLKTFDVVLHDANLGNIAAGLKLDGARSTAGATITSVDAKAKTVTVRIPISAKKATLAFEGK